VSNQTASERSIEGLCDSHSPFFLGSLSQGRTPLPSGVTPDKKWAYHSIMANRADDWLAQADRNLAQARESGGQARHEWACFAAQQAAELAVRRFIFTPARKPGGMSLHGS
jgi:hypothetical protein